MAEAPTQRELPDRWLQAAVTVFTWLGGRRIVELGSMRFAEEHAESALDGRSTQVWARTGAEVITVDIDPQATAVAAAATGGLGNVLAVTQDACEFLEGFEQPIDLLYLDAWDVWTDGAAEWHLKAYQAARKHLHGRSILVIDDTDLESGGKGRLAVPAAIEDGFRVILWGRQTLLARADPELFVDALSEFDLPLRHATSFEEAVTLHQAGRIWEASLVYRVLLRSRPDHAGALHLLGVIHHQQGEHEQAIESIERAIRTDPTKAIYFNNYGAALQEAGRLTDAVASFRAALQIRPDYLDALANLGLVLQLLRHWEEAGRCYEAVLAVQPGHPDALLRRANLFRDLGRIPEAIVAYQDVIKSLPGQSSALVNLGNLLLAEERPEEAAETYQKAIEVGPRRADAHFNLASALDELAQVDDAIVSCRRAVALKPKNVLWRLRADLFCRKVFRDNAEIDAYRDQLSARLDTYDPGKLRFGLDEIPHSGCVLPFHLSHQGRDDRAIKTKFASLFRNALPQFEPTSPRAGRPRVGFVVTRGHEGIFLRCMTELLRGLSPDRVDATIVCSAGSLSRIRDAIACASLGYLAIPEQFSQAVETVRAAAFDVLYYWEVGTDPVNYFLALLRLAPVQCTSWGIQVTSGVPTIDYYLSSELLEPPNADPQYTERLIRFKTLLSVQAQVPLPSPSKDRGAFGFSQDDHLYVCAQNLLKFYPDQDAVFGEILRRDPRGLLVVKQGKRPHLASLLEARFREHIPDVCQRIRFVPWLEGSDYLDLIRMADVALDTFHMGAGSTTYDTFSMGTPLVTWPSGFSRGRYTDACYRKMGLRDQVADSPEHFVDIAVRLGTDASFCREMRLRIEEKRHAIFDDSTLVQEFHEFLENAVAAAR